MSARSKLNGASLNGARLLAALVGGLAQSWLTFVVVLAVSLATAWHAGDIRPRPRRR